MHPSAKIFYDAAFATPNRPFRVADQLAEKALPMLTSDLIEIAKQDPKLLPALAPLISAGMGSQTYDKSSINKPKFIPSQYDLTLK